MAKEKAPLPAAAPAGDKQKAIDTAMAQIEKMYGKGSIMRFLFCHLFVLLNKFYINLLPSALSRADGSPNKYQQQSGKQHRRAAKQQLPARVLPPRSRDGPSSARLRTCVQWPRRSHWAAASP